MCCRVPNPSLPQPPASPTCPTASTLRTSQMPGTPPLTVRAYNEYGEFDRRALKMYGFEMVVEPFRKTTLKVEEATETQASTYWWRLIEADTDGEDNGSTLLVNTQGGSTMTASWNSIRSHIPGDFCLASKCLRSPTNLTCDGTWQMQPCVLSAIDWMYVD